eukprot:scaffold694_cov338-Pavlova_lutheri.AAC.41
MPSTRVRKRGSPANPDVGRSVPLPPGPTRGGHRVPPLCLPASWGRGGGGAPSTPRSFGPSSIPSRRGGKGGGFPFRNRTRSRWKGRRVERRDRPSPQQQHHHPPLSVSVSLDPQGRVGGDVACSRPYPHPEPEGRKEGRKEGDTARPDEKGEGNRDPPPFRTLERTRTLKGGPGSMERERIRTRDAEASRRKDDPSHASRLDVDGPRRRGGIRTPPNLTGTVARGTERDDTSHGRGSEGGHVRPFGRVSRTPPPPPPFPPPRRSRMYARPFQTHQDEIERKIDVRHRHLPTSAWCVRPPRPWSPCPGTPPAPLSSRPVPPWPSPHRFQKGGMETE